jgi:hypothetical protein
MVFKVRYGGVSGEPPRIPASEGEITRCPGTVDGYRRIKGDLVKARPDCDIREACLQAERAFDLKHEQHRWWDISVHPETGKRDEGSVRPALIAKRKSDGLMPEGTATRAWLYRALRYEADLYKKRGQYWARMELSWQRTRFAERKRRKARQLI